ncbi:putative capsid protein of prophage [Geomicrobium sp. JCM 19037]|uniref:major capsid protein n=1 Tax=Geomicrobium sp. JCM 19037 TaxID=1460634 RepID=UPI00045F348D|nr:major capsid protein [Geomicrobium sp. JCM 19037]GAK06042.1 putative capsid protein of prophage [Geomicrobium sp. JCM 19037]
MTNISYYDPRLLLTTIENLPPTHTFLRDTFFGGAARTFFTEKVDVEYRKGRRKMAPFVHPKLGGKAMSREGYKVQTFAPASVKPKMVLDVEDLMVKGFGENIYSNRKPSERAAEIIARDMATMNDSIVRREEWMAAQILTTGRVDIIGEGIDSFLDFDFDNKKTLSGTSLWNHETQMFYVIFGNGACPLFKSPALLQICF